MPYEFEQYRLLWGNNIIETFDGVMSQIHAAMYQPVADLDVTAWPTAEPVSFDTRRSGKKIELKPSQKWGEVFDCAWFNFMGTYG